MWSDLFASFSESTERTISEKVPKFIKALEKAKIIEKEIISMADEYLLSQREVEHTNRSFR